MKVGDLIRIGKHSNEYGIISWVHPTKGVVRVYWHDGFNWESCARLEILSLCDIYDEIEKEGEKFLS